MPTADEPPRRSLFAERKIDGQFRKWNTNFGATVKTAEVDEAAEAEEERTEAVGSSAAEGEERVPKPLRLSSDLVPQAFSHFTIDFFLVATHVRHMTVSCDIPENTTPTNSD